MYMILKIPGARQRPRYQEVSELVLEGTKGVPKKGGRK